MGHFSTTASACRFLFPFPSASSLPSILLVLWRRIIRRHSGTAHVQWYVAEDAKRRLRKFWDFSLTSVTDKQWHIPSMRLFCFFHFTVFPYLSLSGHNRRSLTCRPDARHHGSSALRLLTSDCVLFNNSLNPPPNPTSLLRNVTQPLTEVTQAPPLSHPSFAERERERQRQRQRVRPRPTGGVRQLSPISPSNSCSLSISLPLFRFASSPLPVE